jgi:hypothetical protein
MKFKLKISLNYSSSFISHVDGSEETEACLEFGRNFILVDNNPQSIEIMRKRFAGQPIEWIGCEGLG